ncbi:rhomboid family intramembrane serine protease [Micromonospora sp. NPDC049282]|uniref:rhomboid family intramembrane serine protease n=1 Tax=Micromonospora sp. NPDC049282 TaxID=3364269 RepID=UPI00372163B3
MTALAYLVVLAAAVRAGLGLVAGRGSDGRRRAPVATVTALVVVGVPTLLQLTVAPALLGQLERDRAAVADGQVWRLVTSLVVQNGGVAGSVFNLAALAVVGVVAERVWGAKRWVVVALAAGVLAQLWGLVVQPVGAGNSVCR